MSLSKEVNKLFDDIEYKIERVQKTLVDRKHQNKNKGVDTGSGYQPIKHNSSIPVLPSKKV